jgi:diguanylate cyclase (GGDEF)-like protein/PAS domain S-box-containing protein
MRVLTCLAAEHDPWLVVLAATICLLGAWVSVRLCRRACTSSGHAHLGWVFLGAVAAGAAAWCTHFVAMLAYRPGASIGYAPGPTALSLLVAILGAAGALTLAARPHPRAPEAGGAILGASIAAMHYTGMQAVTVEAAMLWDPAAIVVSVLAAIAFAALALGRAARDRAPTGLPTAAALLALAIVALHFLGMAALTILPFAPLDAAATTAQAREMLGLAVAGVGLLMVGTGAASYLVDRQGQATAAGRLRHLADSSADGIAIVQEGRIVEVNGAFETLTGARRAALLGSAVAAWFDDLDSIGPGAAARAVLRAADGAAIPVEVEARGEPARPGEPSLIVHTVRDLRPRLAQERRIAELTRTDGLTGLPNRAAFLEALEQAIADGAEPQRIALLAIDLDRFKEVNDLHGHAVGDLLLRTLSRRLVRTLGRGALAGRIGGDEFVVLAPVPGRAAALDLAERLATALGDPIPVAEREIACGASIGLALYPDDAASADGLMTNAELAMQRAKASPAERICGYDEAMDEAVRARRLLLTELREALARDALALHYQPQVSVATGTITGYEVLLRWPHPQRGFIPPGEFIGLAEESGLIVPLGAWVLRTACAQAAAWRAPQRIAVNVSAVQLADPTLPELVARTLAETGLAPARLELEITESALIRDPARSAEVLRRIKALGVSIAMDDFGTGYSSLSMLRAFPFDKIKLDRSFMGEIDRSDEARAIIRAVLALAESLGIAVLAEGVETEAQLAFLREEGCAEVQGYLLGPPVPRLVEPARALT